MNHFIKIVATFCLIVFCALLSSAQSPAAYERAGDNAMQIGDYATANTYYYSAFIEENDNAEYAFKLAESCRLYNDYENAERYYTKVAVLDKNNKFPLADFYLAEMKQRLGDYDDSKKIYENYVQFNSKDSSSYFYAKAKREIINCDVAKELLKDTLKADINNMGSDVNSVYSDFAAQMIDSTQLYYSSLRFENKDKKYSKKNKYIAKILSTENEKNVWSKPMPLDKEINKVGLHACNSAISTNKKLMIYTQCTRVGDKLICELYQSKNVDGNWTTPQKLNDSINSKGYTSTQPCVANDGIIGYTLYFVSDKPGGLGKMDIWKVSISADLRYGTPVNLGAPINTVDDDITPSFDNITQTLYFSSEGHKGLGGFDIYKSKFEQNSFSEPVNAGNPLNTSYNEIYFSVAKTNRYLFSSNRPGSMYIKSRTCCYDIYECVLKDTLPKVTKTDSVIAIEPINPVINDPAIVETNPIKLFEALLPLKLYFENDRPDPKTIQTTTSKNYVTLYGEYIANQPKYNEQYALSLTDANQKAEAEQKINSFFDITVKKSFTDLDRFTKIMIKQLKDGNKVELIIRGSASPLANSAYNKNLSKRRISSVLNYWKSINEGELVAFTKSGKLKIIEEPVGEDMVSKSISDNLKDQRNSVYSPEASALRYIEVIKVRLNGIQSE